MNGFTYVLSFIEGVLTFISPCILPLLPIYFFYLAGEAAGSGEERSPRGKQVLLINSLGFVAGFTLIFVILGATATSLGAFLKGNLGLLQKVSGLVMIVFGLNFLGVFRLGFLNTEKRFEYNFKRINFYSAILLGIVFGFGWTPCGGQFLGAALLTAANSGTVLQGILLLFLYSMGLGIPFIIVAVVFDRAKGMLKQIQKQSRIINVVSGIVLILAGVLILTGNLQYVSYYLGSLKR